MKCQKTGSFAARDFLFQCLLKEELMDHYIFDRFHTKLHLLQNIIHNSHNYMNIYFVDKDTFPCGRKFRDNLSEVRKCPLGQFSIPQPLGSRVKLLVNKKFHLMFSFVQFELFSPASCSGGIVLFKNGNFYCGHKAPWELIITSFREHFYINIKNTAISKIQFYYQIFDSGVYKYHLFCISFDCKGYETKCSYLKYFRESDIWDNIHIVQKLQSLGKDIMIFRLFVKRYQNLVIKLFFQQLFLQVHDEPDIYSKETVLSNRNTVLSSFQLTIVMMKENLDANIKVFQLMFFGTIINMMNLSLNNRANWHKIHLGKICPKGLLIIYCRIKVPNFVGNFIHISVDKLSYLEQENLGRDVSMEKSVCTS